MADADDRSDDGDGSMADFGDSVDNTVFSQILEIDESEEDRDFSMPLVMGFFEQAHETFDKIDKAVEKKDLKELSSLGHFLKGSSATLGFNKIRDSCQTIQQYGHKLTLDGAPETDEDICLQKIKDALKSAKEDTSELEVIMKNFFGQG